MTGELGSEDSPASSAQPESPRLRALLAAIPQDEAALDAFWREIAEAGTPLVERIPGEPDACLATFLWREDPGVPLANVVHVEWYSPGELRDRRFALLPGADIWYRTLRVRSDVRGVYRILPNDSLRPLHGDPAFEERFARMRLDPLNPRRVLPERLVGTAKPDWGDASVFVMSDAQPLTGHRVPEDVPHGPVDEVTVPSAILGQDRTVWVHRTPRATGDERDARLLIQFDGDRCLDCFDLPWLLDGLAATGEIPPLVTLMVDTPDRGIDLPCNDAFVAFLADELIPWARDHSHYPIAPGPTAVIAAGQSYGGLAAAWAALRRPDAIGNALCQSGSFWWMPGLDDLPSSPRIGDAPGYAWLPGQVAGWPRADVRFFMEAGVLEAGNEGVEPSLLATNRHLRDVLVAKGYDVMYREYAGGHDYHVWRGTFPDGLMHLTR